ncbi:hypothetical protein COHA_007788 [Chlorella ohadii]|uniref:Protein kinase domain-containing protein n=1 Tax=Chlorella ohadii TaxID=2649997 RepID=A0AAD5H326_9CHLO|nr:hypothetical protein COHA_007788 [Chlorella ohadii]
MAQRVSPEQIAPLPEGAARFEQVRHLNRGAFGMVTLAKDLLHGDLVALKYIARGAQHISKYTEREIVNHMKLHHPHVIALREVFLTATHLVLVMEYAAGGDLAHYVAGKNGVTEAEARWFFQQLIVAVDYCHRMGVSSRDIKLQNILLDGSPQPLIKLADFGFSKDTNQHSAPNSRVGTPAYLAPEVVKLQLGQKYDGQKADIWSCGVALYALVTNELPFRRAGDESLGHNQKVQAMLGRVLKAEYTFPAHRQLSDGIRDLIARILVVDPEKRLSIQEIQTHPWFMEGLNPAALQYNDTILQLSLESQPPQEVLDEVRAVVQEAVKWPASRMGQQGAEGSNPDAMVAAAAAESGSSFDISHST